MPVVGYGWLEGAGSPRPEAAKSLVTLAAAALSTTPGCTAGPGDATPASYPEPLVFSQTPSGFSDIPLVAAQPVLKMLTEETGRTIRVQTGSDYDAVIEGMRSGAIDIGALSPFSYVRAKQENPAIFPVAAQATEKGAKPGYYAYGIVPAGSPIRNLGDLRGRRVCFVDDDSTSGYVYPSAVVAHQCDAGFAYDTMVDRQLIERGRLQPGQVDIMWKSQLIPGAAMVVSNTLTTDLRNELITAIQQKANSDYLRANGFCQGECPISDANAYAYTPVDDSVYDSVRDVCRRISRETC